MSSSSNTVSAPGAAGTNTTTATTAATTTAAPAVASSLTTSLAAASSTMGQAASSSSQTTPKRPKQYHGTLGGAPTTYTSYTTNTSSYSTTTYTGSVDEKLSSFRRQAKTCNSNITIRDEVDDIASVAEMEDCCAAHVLRCRNDTRRNDDDVGVGSNKSDEENVDVVDSSSLDSILQHFSSYLQTTAFQDFCAAKGLIDPSVSIKTPSPDLLGKFRREIEQYQKQQKKATQGGVRLGVVFHGTAKGNIKSILKSGLDPSRRVGQAYGVGDYFSKDPSTSLSYCKGGRQMLVFCVVIPTHTTGSPDKSSSTTSSRTQVQQRYIVSKPLDYVVVEKTQHQLPIAVLEFSGSSAEAASRSNMQRNKLQRLHRLAKEAEATALESSLKADIIQLIFQRETEFAAHKFKKSAKHFCDISKLEISFYAHQHLDEEFVSYLFGEQLPAAPDWETFQDKIVSVEAQEELRSKAWDEVKECKQELKGQVLLKSESLKNKNKNTTSAAGAASSSSEGGLRSRMRQQAHPQMRHDSEAGVGAANRGGGGLPIGPPPKALGEMPSAALATKELASTTLAVNDDALLQLPLASDKEVNSQLHQSIQHSRTSVQPPHGLAASQQKDALVATNELIAPPAACEGNDRISPTLSLEATQTRINTKTLKHLDATQPKKVDESKPRADGSTSCSVATTSTFSSTNTE